MKTMVAMIPRSTSLGNTVVSTSCCESGQSGCIPKQFGKGKGHDSLSMKDANIPSDLMGAAPDGRD